MLKNPEHEVREAAFCVNGRGFLLREKNWAYIQYAENASKGIELFDMQKDPKQYTNLAGVAQFDVHIADPALAVFAGAAPGNRGDDYRCRRFSDPALVPGGTGQVRAQVAPDGACQSVLCRMVAVAAGRLARLRVVETHAGSPLIDTCTGWMSPHWAVL